MVGMGNLGPEKLFEMESSRLSQNYEISRLNDDIASLTDKITGSNKLFKITPSRLTLSPQTQIIDLINEDTTIYANRYIYHDEIPITGELGAYPPVFNDLNENGKLDIVGMYLPPDDRDSAMIAIVELQENQQFIITKIFDDGTVVNAMDYTDLNNDSRNEINLRVRGGSSFNNYMGYDSLFYPDSINLNFEMWEKTGGPSHEHFTDADNDGITDILYIGQEQANPAGQKVFVAEYDSASNNFVKRFSHLAITYDVWGLAYGDFDADGLTEFMTGSIDGDVFVYENVTNDTYAPIFHDTISTPNAYLVCATNDIDRNGKTEFFVGGSSYYNGIGGTKVYWFEADGDNNYIKKYTFFLAGTGVLGTTEIFNLDANMDGIDDLVFCFDATIVILKWNQDGYFELIYLDWEENWDSIINSVTLYDIYNSGKPDLIVGYFNLNKVIPYYSVIRKSNLLSHVSEHDKDPIPSHFHLYQNYPNPFNGATRIRFQIMNQQRISLVVYDIAGKEVIRIVDDNQFNPGEHEFIWKGTNKTGMEVSSGVYILRMMSQEYHSSIKMVLTN
jgi:hypothetical protein